MHLIQVTLTAGAATPLGSPLQGIANGQFFQQLVIQNNTASTVRVGDSTVSSTRGILLESGVPGGSITTTLSIQNSGTLNEWYAYSAAAVTIDIMLID